MQAGKTCTYDKISLKIIGKGEMDEEREEGEREISKVKCKSPHKDPQCCLLTLSLQGGAKAPKSPELSAKKGGKIPEERKEKIPTEHRAAETEQAQTAGVLQMPRGGCRFYS